MQCKQSRHFKIPMMFTWKKSVQYLQSYKNNVVFYLNTHFTKLISCSVVNIMNQFPNEQLCFPKTILEHEFDTFNERTDDLNTLFKPKQFSSILKQAMFDGKLLSTRNICLKLQTLPFIKTLRLTSVHDVVPVIRKICRCNKQLEQISLKDCTSEEINEIPEKVLINLLLSFPDLRAIELKKTKFESHMFYELVAKQSNVTSIDISLNDLITLDDLMMLAHNSRLKEFKMSRRCKEPKISDLEMAHLVNSMREQLTLLHLDMSGLSSFTYNEVLCCSKLVDVKLNGAMNLSGDILKQVPKALTNIQHFKIEGPSLLTQKDFQSLFLEGKLFLNLLETLNFHNYDCLNDTACCNILEVCSNLKYLSLKGCKSLTVEGIYTPLLNLSNLTHLNIAFIGKSTGISSLVLNLPKLKKLTVDEPSYELNKLSLVKSVKTIFITQLGQKNKSTLIRR